MAPLFLQALPTEVGRSFLAQDPKSPGSLGIAISEAVEVAASSGGKKKYCLGSVLNHVLMHQTIIGEEALKQMALADEYPDVVIGCVGGGSNFAGIAFPFLRETLKGRHSTRLLAVEPTATPSLTKGTYAYDYGDSAKLAPMVRCIHSGMISFLLQSMLVDYAIMGWLPSSHLFIIQNTSMQWQWIRRQYLKQP
jgi:predicted alternative tryptophan synthase beta-subunit